MHTQALCTYNVNYEWHYAQLKLIFNSLQDCVYNNYIYLNITHVGAM